MSAHSVNRSTLKGPSAVVGDQSPELFYTPSTRSARGFPITTHYHHGARRDTDDTRVRSGRFWPLLLRGRHRTGGAMFDVSALALRNWREYGSATPELPPQTQITREGRSTQSSPFFSPSSWSLSRISRRARCSAAALALQWSIGHDVSALRLRNVNVGPQPCRFGSTRGGSSHLAL